MSQKSKNNIYHRLVREWEIHNSIIVAVDYDGTVSPWNDRGEEVIKESRIVDILKKVQETGAYLVCFTACDENRFPEIKKRFETLGLKLDAINENPIDLPYGNHRKMYYNILLDDRAGLYEALDTLKKACYTIRGKKNTESILNMGVEG